MGNRAKSANAMNHRRQLHNNATNSSPMLCKLKDLLPIERVDWSVPHRSKKRLG